MNRSYSNYHKLFQKEYCLENDFNTIYWSYDPLEARNAYLNINKLGADIESYTEEYYPDSNSNRHKNIGTDRFIVKWTLKKVLVVSSTFRELLKLS